MFSASHIGVLYMCYHNDLNDEDAKRWTKEPARYTVLLSRASSFQELQQKRLSEIVTYDKQAEGAITSFGKVRAIMKLIDTFYTTSEMLKLTHGLSNKHLYTANNFHSTFFCFS